MNPTGIPFLVDPETAPKLSQVPGLEVFVQPDL